MSRRGAARGARILCAMACLAAAGAALTGCGYLRMAARRQYLKEVHKMRPSQSIAREVEAERCHTVYGMVKALGPIRRNLAICAISYRYGQQDIVASAFVCGKGYYALLLPAGQYQLVAFSDVNGDSMFTASECAGFHYRRPFVEIKPEDPAVIGGFDMYVSDTRVFELDQPVSIALPESFACNRSSYYPPGAVRSLDDPLFSESAARAGRYNAADFLTRSGIYFYALSERDPRKTPVLFVHGYGGTPRNFRACVARLDTARYDPWFFYYPGAQSIGKTADVFYEIFFSDNIIRLAGRRMVIVAHSMGGLVARRALNRYSGAARDHAPVEFISLCTPYGGVAAASAGARQAPAPAPSWSDIASNSEFIRTLPETGLADAVSFRLFFGYRDESVIRFAENSDGSISLKSQLHPPIQRQAGEVRGFNETHTSILSSEAVLGALLEAIEQ